MLLYLSKENIKRIEHQSLLRIKANLDRIAIEEIKEKLYIAEINS